MSYTLHVDPKGSYLYVTVTGENSYDNVARYLSEVRDMCRKYDCSHVLIVENLSGPSLDTFSVYDLISRNSEQTFGKVRKIAYVDINPEHNAKTMKFAEDVAVNRGVFVRIFSTIHEAEQWMARQESPGEDG